MASRPAWRIIVSPPAEKDLAAIPAKDRARILVAIDELRGVPRRGDLRKLQGTQEEWRLRVGDWRVRLGFDPKNRLILIFRVLHRREAYR